MEPFSPGETGDMLVEVWHCVFEVGEVLCYNEHIILVMSESLMQFT